MTEIKTPEEIAKAIFECHWNLINGEIDRHGLIKDIAKYLSAERNANLEKIKRLDRCWGALGIKTYADAKGKAIDEIIVELEAEAKAVRQTTIEECAKVADEFLADYRESVGEYKGHLQSQFLGSCDSAVEIAEAIRALNSKQDN